MSNWYGHFIKKDPTSGGRICGTPFLEREEKDLLLGGAFDSTLRVSKYRFSCKFKEDTQLPPYKGLLYKNALEQALKNISCGLREKDCQNCFIQGDCLYSQMKEVPEARLILCKAYSAFLPYVIESLENEKTEFISGESFEFNLILFGVFGSRIPNFIYAVQEMGRIGIGKAKSEERGGIFELKSVTILNQKIYSSSDNKFQKELLNGKSITICFNRLLYYTRLCLKNSCKIKICSPLKFKVGNKLITEAPSFLN